MSSFEKSKPLHLAQIRTPRTPERKLAYFNKAYSNEHRDDATVSFRLFHGVKSRRSETALDKLEGTWFRFEDTRNADSALQL
jgi:hypothetical protein